MNLENIIFRYLPDFLYNKETNYVKQQWFCYKWVKRHIDWSKEEVKYASVVNADVQENQTIFMYWKQGWDNAPVLVKKCLCSVEKNRNGHPLVLLDENNINDYIKLPQFIEQYHSEGKIKEALYSDMLRISLLETYGGYWLDATCLLTSPIPSIIEKSAFFMFSNALLPEWSSPIKGSNWFICSKKGNLLLGAVKNFLFNYWKHKTYLVNYYIFHICLSAIVDSCKQYQDIWKTKPYICNMNPHVLQFSFAEEFQQEKYDFILSQSFVHKLTYKFDNSLLLSQPKNIIQQLLNS